MMPRKQIVPLTPKQIEARERSIMILEAQVAARPKSAGAGLTKAIERHWQVLIDQKREAVNPQVPVTED
jgi:hypothetical protein